LQCEDDAFDVLKKLMLERDPVYREVADLIIDTDKKALKNIVKTIIGALAESESIG
jgi:shikimate kinase